MPAREAAFRRLDEATAEDFAIVAPEFAAQHELLADNVLGALRALAGPKLGMKVDRLEHSLQTATLAARDGASEELVVAGLLHDVGDLLAPDNHGAFAAEMLRPFVADETYHVVRMHTVFQGYYYFHLVGQDRDARERYRGHPAFDAAAAFVERYDMRAFDPDYDSMPLAAFEPMVRRLFAKPPHVPA